MMLATFIGAMRMFVTESADIVSLLPRCVGAPCQLECSCWHAHVFKWFLIVRHDIKNTRRAPTRRAESAGSWQQIL
jgi:hypothetical protein